MVLCKPVVCGIRGRARAVGRAKSLSRGSRYLILPVIHIIDDVLDSSVNVRHVEGPSAIRLNLSYTDS